MTTTNIKKLRRLAPALHRQCENSCNGKGYIPFKGSFSLADKETYIKEDYTVFDQEINRLESKITVICKEENADVNFQRDPRGWEVEIFENERNVSHLIYN